jgi:hypothetical protein
MILANTRIGTQNVAIPINATTGDVPETRLTTSSTKPANAAVSSTLRKSCCTTSKTRIAPLIVANPGINMVIAIARPALTGRASSHAATDGTNPVLGRLVPIGVRQQRQETRTFHSRLQLPLVNGLGPRDATRNNLACFRDVGFEQIEILVIDLLNIFCSKTAILTSA